MSRLPSSKSAALVAGLVLAACSRAPQPATTTAPASHGTVGYVRMGDLLKKHPLYGELARLDESMQALQLRSVGGGSAMSAGDLARAQAELQRELEDAANRTKKALKDKQDEYAKREQEAINAALAAAGVATTGGGIASSVARESQVQAQSAAVAAQQNFDAYRRQLIDQDRHALQALQRSLNDEASRRFRARADQLQKQEADFALQQASEDASERLSLRTKLSNLALDDAARDDVKKRLDELDRKEADALAAMKNRDSATLAALQKQLRDRTQKELAGQASAMQKRTVGKLDERDRETRKDLVGQLGAVAVNGPGAGAVNVPADLRPKLQALHQKYQEDFNKDAQQTIAQFEKTKSDLSRRFQQLQGIDAGAQAGANKQLDALQKQRGELYSQMVAQIGREVRLVAARRGVDVVFGDVVAPAGGVDLTADAEKDIESLHV